MLDVKTYIPVKILDIKTYMPVKMQIWELKRGQCNHISYINNDF